MAKYEEHQFYCLLCGRPGIPLSRKSGFKHEAFHRKKLYCPWCKTTCNFIEITNQEEKETFLENFKNGVYKDEGEASLATLRSARLG